MISYDYLIVGAGLFGATFAHQATKAGKKVLVIDQRNHIGGNCYTENIGGIEVHKYGAHIFHTDNEQVWQFINQFGTFYSFINQPVAIVKGITYNLPFNMNTFSKVFNVTKPDDVLHIINEERAVYRNLVPRNLEEQAIKGVGRTIYELLIKEYTQKQWGKKCTELPRETITRIPIRLTYNNNYFNDKYQAIPKDGYTSIIKNMLQGITVGLNTTYDQVKNEMLSEKVIYTGMIDEFFNYEFGELEYRSLKFQEVEYNTPNFQGNAVMNYPTNEVGYIRTIEHKHFVPTNTPNTIVSYEFSVDYKRGMIPFYPVKTKSNQDLYEKYLEKSKEYPNIHFSGRLGSFRYFDMDDTIENALLLADKLL